MNAARWIRLLAIGIAAVVLASCRSLTAPLALTATSVTILPDDLPVIEEPTAAGLEPSSLTAALLPVSPEPTAAAELEATAFDASESGPGSPAVRWHQGAVTVGCEAPCPPLPRLGLRAGRCGPGRCGPVATASSCGPEGCVAPAACMACEPAVPVLGPYLVCDGGDHGPLARPRGDSGLDNLTAGDTVARYRPADDGPEHEIVHLTTSNCACVYAPRFASVREVVRPLEDAAPIGPGGLVNDELVELQVERQPVWGSVQNLAPEAARKALPGVAVEDATGPLAVDQEIALHEDDGRERPAEELAIDQPEQTRQRERPIIVVGFDVPVAWTCIKAANVLLNDTAPQVVAADRGTATLRFEEPGRAELTLCKRAGTDTARVGEELDFTIFMLNSGDRPLTGITLADALPSRLELVPRSAASSLPAAFATETGDDGSVVLTWRLSDTLQPGESGFVRFRVTVR
ncbi:MAG: hypothetical protein RLZZ440_1834 [Planctomycetota bacterium]